MGLAGHCFFGVSLVLLSTLIMNFVTISRKCDICFGCASGLCIGFNYQFCIVCQHLLFKTCVIVFSLQKWMPAYWTMEDVTKMLYAWKLDQTGFVSPFFSSCLRANVNVKTSTFSWALHLFQVACACRPGFISQGHRCLPVNPCRKVTDFKDSIMANNLKSIRYFCMQ